jgi:hypothetical protein
MLGRGASVTALALATGAAALHACVAGGKAHPLEPDASSGGRPPDDAEAAEAADAPAAPAAPRPADAAVVFRRCEPADLDAAAPYERLEADGDPPAATGGAIAPGTYVLERRTTYRGDAGTPDAQTANTLRAVVEITADAVRFTGEGLDCSPWQGCGRFIAVVAQEYTVSGAELRFRDVCDVNLYGGQAPSSARFSTDGGSLDLLLGPGYPGTATVLGYRRR